MSSTTPTRTSVKYAWIPLFLVTLVILLVVGSGEEGPVAEGSVLHAFTGSPLFTDEAPESTLSNSGSGVPFCWGWSSSASPSF